MPWRGPAFPGEFPTLGYLVAEWVEAHCVIPDRHVAGQPFRLSDPQLNHLLWEFRLWPNAEVDWDRPSSPFVYFGNVLVRSQKWGKSPFSAARICAQAQGPVLFAGWDANGEPVGAQWPRPHIQVVAISEDQTANIWRSLVPMIEDGALGAEIPDVGLTRINLRRGGLIEPVTAAARSRLGARVTYVEFDQTESATQRNGGHDLVSNIQRNLAGTGGRWSMTPNAWDPSESSVAQVEVETAGPDVFVNYPEPLPGSWHNKRERRRILRHAYEGAPWVDMDRIEADCERLARKGKATEAERWFGNRVVAGADRAFDPEVFKALSGLVGIDADRLVALGFDGALVQDATVLAACDIETGHTVPVAVWERPPELDEDADWSVPIDELDEAVAFAFDFWDVWRLYGDPPHYREDMARWAGEHEGQVVEWWTNNRRKMAYALKGYRTDMRPGVMSHGPLNDSDEAAEHHEAFVRHHLNAVKRRTNIRDEDDGKFMWLISKDGPRSPRKIDGAMAGCLAWEARHDAMKAGVLERKVYSRARW